MSRAARPATRRRAARAAVGVRHAGVLLHPTSLDGPDGIGDIGPAAHRFLGWLASAGFSAWQMLPIGPVGRGNSPYSTLSSFAGESMLLSLDALVEEGWLSRRRLELARRSASGRGTEARGSTGRVGWDAARRFKRPLLLEAYEGFLSQRGSHRTDYRRFLESTIDWLPAWCALGTPVEGSPGETAFLQFAFERQWTALRRRATRLGVELIGDLPIFVGDDAVDRIAHPELFRLDRAGRPTVVTGVPPDCFSRDGQRWGHPHYRWSAHRRDGFRWWRRRVRAALERFDLLRIDHFVGFVNAYEIPARSRTARHGRWGRTPGRELLTALRRELGALPFIAEDLGAVTPAVTALRDAFDLPGMRLIQNAFGAPDSPDLPHRHAVRCVAYPGTHDNDTTRGWWRTLDAPSRGRFLHYAGGSSREAVRSMIRIACTSPAELCVIPMQDLLELGSEARMNLPGRAHGQWSWRMPRDWARRVDRRWIHATLAASARVSRTKKLGSGGPS